MNEAAFLEGLFKVAVSAANPSLCVPPHLPSPPDGRTIVVGAGKAAASMAQAVENNWRGDLSGLVVTRYGHGLECKKIEVVEAAHPVPDAAGIAAARKTLSLVQGLSEKDLVLFLGSGGGSSLLSHPSEGITLEDKQAVTRALLASGAAIGEINRVRKHLSSLKGGRLALAAVPARVVGLLISDVANDDLAVIVSGPTVPDSTTRHDALAVLDRYGIAIPESVGAHLDDPRSETPKEDQADFSRIENIIVATARGSIDAAARRAESTGVRAVVLDYALEESASVAAKSHADAVRAIKEEDGSKPCVLLSGGEVTVRLNEDAEYTRNSLGGPNTEFLLALALALEPIAGVWAIACDTDGIDGSGDNAGAFLTPDTLSRARSLGLDPQDYLARNDSYRFFEALDALVHTGPTRTNVNDFRAILIGPSQPDC